MTATSLWSKPLSILSPTAELAAKQLVLNCSAKPDYDPNILKACGLSEDDLSVVTKMLEDYLNLFKPCFCDRQEKSDPRARKKLIHQRQEKSDPLWGSTLEEKWSTNTREHSPFDDEMMLKIYQDQLSRLLGDDDCMLNVDGSDFPKKGKNSVGVKRQYCGIMGKTENCQAGVFLGYSSKKGYSLLDRRLYMPETWFNADFAA